MPAATPRPVGDRLGDVEGSSHISLFSLVEQVAERTPQGLLHSRLHQQGQVVGRGLDSLYVRFADNQVLSLPPRLLRLLSGAPAEDLQDSSGRQPRWCRVHVP
ncbi:MAG: hypothetical protein ACRDQI_08195 [Pseudonocardiaceae bacterium]